MSKFVPFTHVFNDPWGDNPEGETTITFHFAKPSITQIKRLQDTASKNPNQASRDLLLSTVQEAEKEDLKAKMEEYPGIITTFSAVMMKAIGISSELGK